MDEIRCDRCNRLNLQGDHHMTYDCENWPEMAIGQNSTEYKGFTIVRFGYRWLYALTGEDCESTNVGRVTDAFMQIDQLRCEEREE